MKKFLFLYLSLCLLTSCGQKRAQLGEVEFSVTGKPEAQPYFEKGLLLLHSFEYEDAAEEFQKASEIDPDFAMAYWGEAMTHNHPLWRYQDGASADSVIALLGATPSERVLKAQTPIEKDFITGVNILYGEGTKAFRDSAYAAHMGELYQKYPGNDEVAAFYSIALIGSVPVGRDVKVYEHAAMIAKEVLARNPKHPGALHYTIHAYDDPDHASLAMMVADAYAQVAPDAGHALHMPSHIYLASGLWDKVVSSNEVAWAADKKRKEEKNLTNEDLNYHALHWLMYGYLQQGRIAEAKKLVDDMKTYCAELPSSRARTHLIYLKTTYLVETNDYDGEVASIEVDKRDLNIATRALDHFAHGMQAYHADACLTLDSIIRHMTAERLLEEEKSSGSVVRTCSGVNSLIPDALDLQCAQIMEIELHALQAWEHNDDVGAEKLLRQAVDMESSSSFIYGPPSIVKPSYELYGEWLLAHNRPKEAMQQFERALKVHPGRALSVKGKAACETI